MNGSGTRSGMGWGARLLVALALILAGAAATVWGLAHYQPAARVLGIAPPPPQAVPPPPSPPTTPPPGSWDWPPPHRRRSRNPLRAHRPQLPPRRRMCRVAQPMREL